MRVIILEGARGVGKSTVTQALRQENNHIISMNLTGVSQDDETVPDTMFKSHANVLKMLLNEAEAGSPFTYVLDRSFFSEEVYSRLYKSYSFTAHYATLVSDFLEVLVQKVDVKMVFLEADTSLFEARLANKMRKRKATLFDRSELDDGVETSTDQQLMYTQLFSALPEVLQPYVQNIHVRLVDTPQQIANNITD